MMHTVFATNQEPSWLEDRAVVPSQTMHNVLHLALFHTVVQCQMLYMLYMYVSNVLHVQHHALFMEVKALYITVRNFSPDVWNDFLRTISAIYGTQYGHISQELEKAITSYISRFDSLDSVHHTTFQTISMRKMRRDRRDQIQRIVIYARDRTEDFRGARPAVFKIIERATSLRDRRQLKSYFELLLGLGYLIEEPNEIGIFSFDKVRLGKRSIESPIARPGMKGDLQ
jgi:hypothetical protein